MELTWVGGSGGMARMRPPLVERSSGDGGAFGLILIVADDASALENHPPPFRSHVHCRFPLVIGLGNGVVRDGALSANSATGNCRVYLILDIALFHLSFLFLIVVHACRGSQPH